MSATDRLARIRSVGLPAERKDGERRVAVVPEGVEQMVAAGLTVVVERGAGKELGIEDGVYEQAGARLVFETSDVWACDMVVKVKEPQPEEFTYLRPGLVLFAFLHLSANSDLADALRSSGVATYAFEDVVDAGGGRPVLRPMSEIAGRAAAVVAAELLGRWRGQTIGGAVGVPPARCTILGLGTAGTHAARALRGHDATCRAVEIDHGRAALAQDAGLVAECVAPGPDVAELLAETDVIVAAALRHGDCAPVVIDDETLRSLRDGAVVIDLAIDEGGNLATSRVTSFSQPTYVDRGHLHYCVPNVPSLYARTASVALSRQVVPRAIRIARGDDLDAVATGADAAAHVSGAVR